MKEKRISYPYDQKQPKQRQLYSIAERMLSSLLFHDSPRFF
ncbi:MAG: hypothetical protein ABSE95_14255 [Thermodesulfobacteriota bacterium]